MFVDRVFGRIKILTLILTGKMPVPQQFKICQDKIDKSGAS
jgi:hypothetical protein